LLGFLGELESSGEDSLLERMLPGLRSLIRCDAIGLNDIDVRAGSARWLADPTSIARSSSSIT
jgi:hypothetical protein